MPSRCCVPLCKGNYPNGPKVTIHSFPKDEKHIQKWLHRIERRNFYPNENSRVSNFNSLCLCFIFVQKLFKENALNITKISYTFFIFMFRNLNKYPFGLNIQLKRGMSKNNDF